MGPYCLAVLWEKEEDPIKTAEKITKRRLTKQDISANMSITNKYML